MDVHDVKLTISAVAAAQYPEDGHPEIAFLGRSNVGKSSLINKLISMILIVDSFLLMYPDMDMLRSAKPHERSSPP